MTYYRVGYNSTRSALRLSREEGRRPLSRSLDSNKPFGLEKSSPPNVVGLQSVYIIKSAPPPATQPPSLDQS